MLCQQLLSRNTASLRSVRSFTGKAQSMASVLFTWRPFVYMLYGAMSKPPSTLPEGMLYTRQIEQPVTWIATFLSGKKSDIVRVMDVDSHYRRGTRIDIIVDACSWGIGAILSVDGYPHEYMAIPTTEEDARHMGLELSHDSRCQQAFEALAMLIALRFWKYHWINRRSVIHIQGDNTSALSLVTKMQTHSQSIGVVARELALDVSDAVYEPQVATHVPGVANVAADTLSRKFDPEFAYSLPPILASAQEVHPPQRDATWWRSLAPRTSPFTRKQGCNTGPSTGVPDSHT